MEKPFSKLSTIESPSNLASRVNVRIQAAQKRSSFRKIIGFGTLEVASIATLVVSFIYVFGNLKSSGIFQYISLAFTDGAILAYSKELSLSVLEALPAFSIAIALAACVAFTWSTARIIRISKVGHYA